MKASEAPARPLVASLARAAVVLVAALALVVIVGPPRGGALGWRARRAPPAAAEAPTRLPAGSIDEGAFELLPAPRPGEWRDVHPEPRQSFDDFRRDAPLLVTSGQPTLVFLPLGASTDQDRALLDAAIELAGLWFELPARVLPAEPVPAGAPSRERRFAWSSQPTAQYASWWFLEEYLPRRRPPDAVLLAAVTASDLYPAESWNYVFGEADPRRRAAVFSFLRMRPEFWGERAGAARLALRRALLLTVHELGHVFGLAHCAQFRCAMNGANSLEEWDRAPLHLCPDCLRKLQWSRGFDALERYRRLQAFFARRGLREEAGWVARRVRRLAAR